MAGQRCPQRGASKYRGRDRYFAYNGKYFPFDCRVLMFLEKSRHRAGTVPFEIKRYHGLRVPIVSSYGSS